MHPVVGNHDLLYPQGNDVGLFNFDNPLWLYYIVDDDFTRITMLLTGIFMAFTTMFAWIAVFEFLKFWFNAANI